MVRRRRRTLFYWPLKRIMDIVVSLIVLVLTSPIIALAAIFVRLNLGSPIIFSQPRPGKGGKVFTLYKFRSMRDVNRTKGLVTDEQRLTRFGKILRSTSIDELPSLFNVLKGDMSLVGPRPLLVDYLERYSPTQARRHEVRPGMTGLAQVRGRNALSWNEKFALDVEYVDSCNICLDLQIMYETIIIVFARQGISSADHATMKEFLGDDE